MRDEEQGMRDTECEMRNKGKSRLLIFNILRFGTFPICVFKEKQASGSSRLSISDKNGFRDNPDCLFLRFQVSGRSRFAIFPKLHFGKIQAARAWHMPARSATPCFFIALEAGLFYFAIESITLCSYLVQ